LLCFLREAEWDAEQVTRRQIALLRAEPLTTPHADGVPVIHETGVRKDGTHTGQSVPGHPWQARQWHRGGNQFVGGPADVVPVAGAPLHTGGTPSWRQAA